MKKSKEEIEAERKKALLIKLRKGPDLDRYIEEKKRRYTSYAGGARNYIDDPEKKEMIEKLLPAGKKKWVRYDEGALLYSMGLHSFEELAKKAKAVYHVNRIVLVNTEKVDEYMELMCADDPTEF